MGNTVGSGLKFNLTGNSVYVLGVDYLVRNEIPWTDAVTHILQGTMTPFLVHPTRRVRSAGGLVDMAHPLMVRMSYWRNPAPVRAIDEHSRASRRDILRRDGWTCRYCGKHANTVDHVKPESRCIRDGDAHAGWTFGNLVAACFQCNNDKADRTPEEAGMKMLWDNSKISGRYDRVQDEVWRILKSIDDDVLEAQVFEGLLS